MTKSEPVKPPPSAVSADASPQPAAPQQHLASPSPVDAPTATAARETESASSTRTARGRGTPQRPPSASPAPRASASRPSAPATPAVSAPPAALRPAPGGEPLAPFPTASPELPASYLAAPSVSLPALPPLDAAPDDFASETTEYPPSRLSGLRNLLVSLGRRSLDQENESPYPPEPGIEPRFERAVRPADQDSTGSANAAPDHGAPTRLTAQPEFLPPRSGAELENEKEKEAVRPTPPRRDPLDGEEIQTLPSWRGQYRKKRYPPI